MNFILGPDETLTSGIEDTARRSSRRPWLLAQLDARAVAAAGVAGRGDPRRHHAEAVAVRGHRRHRRRHDHQHPGSANSGRNWDYRYCWLRDAFFVVRALNSISEVATMEEYLRWLMNNVIRSGGGHIQPLYGIGQEEKLQEAILEHLPGYRGMGPVRVGNQAQEHFQHDVYGNIVLGAAQAFHDHRLLKRAGRAEFVHARGGGRAGLPRLRSPTPACGSCARAPASTPRRPS
jgi:hypothetical protein